MNTKLLTKHCALLLLALFATAWSTQAWAGIKIYVRTEGSASGTAPFLYVWDNNDEPLNGAWSSCQMTETTITADNQTWYVKEFNETSVNAIIHNNLGGNNNQTPDITNIKEDRYYSYKGGSEYVNLTYLYDIPSEAHYVEGKLFVYYVNTSGWNNPKAWVYNDNENFTGGEWPGESLRKVDDTDNLYVWVHNNTGGTPLKVIFSDNGNNQSTAFDYENGGYYDFTEKITTITQLPLNATNFPDPNFRAALAEQFNVNEGGNIEPNNIKVIDVSNHNISNLTGIDHFTNLQELYAGGNDISNNVMLTSNNKLRILDLNGNAQLMGTSSVHTPYIDITKCKVLEEINFANTGCTWMGGLQNIDGGGTYSNLKKVNLHNVGMDYMTSATMQKMPNLEWIDLSDNKLTDNQSFVNNTKLKYIDISNNPQNVKNFPVVALTNLETFKASNSNLRASQTSATNISNPKLVYLDLSENTNLTDIPDIDISTKLEHFDFHGCTSIAPSTLFSSSEISSANNPELKYIDISNVGMINTALSFDGYTKLETLKANNAGWKATNGLIVNNCKAITTIDVTGNALLPKLAVTNCNLDDNTDLNSLIVGLSSMTALHKLDLTSNAFETVPNVNSSTVTTLVLNSNQLTDFNSPEGSSVKYVYAQNNPSLGTGDYTLNSTNLVGLDLGNNGFTKFIMTDNKTLKSLALAGNTNLTEIELHGNTALTQTSPNGIIESDNGLYIKGLSNLKVLNIENSSFSKLGQQNSLQGVTALETLKARHNEFTTFTNGVYALHSVTNSVNYRPADTNESSLEHLVNLKYLDLAYNNLRDSVHLYRNKELRHLDVSHNAVITGVKDGTITTKAQKDAMIEKKGKRLMKYNKKYTAAGVNASDANWTTEYTEYQSKLARPFDLRECDLNDTIGLYHLDLQYNTKLEWLDFSNTAIRNTASGPTYMCPGWMDKDWVTDDNLQAKVATAAGHRWFSSWHSFIYLIPCSELKTIHADNNNMQSMGFMYFPKLDTLTISGMYGDCAYMRDYGTLAVPPRDITLEDTGYGKGNCGLSGSVRKYVSTTWGTDNNGNSTATVNVNYTDPETGANYLNPVKYFDVSNSGYNEVRLNSGVNLEHANVSGNPLNFAVHNTGNSYHNSLDVTYSPNIRTVLAENCADLPIVRAHNRPLLDTLYLSNDANLKTLYVQNDSLLKANFQGLNTLTGLETLFGYNNTQWGNYITFASNTALKNLWISNIGASSINIANNANLEKLRAYDNSLTTLDLSHNGELQWLDVARNKIPEIDLSGNTALQFFNISNGTDTRTQLSGSELDNHDGSDGDGIKPTTVYSADEAPIEDATLGNSLSDLALPASITDARANGNDLHSITGSFANLTNIEFAHNHINGIDLSAASGATVESRDNGRTIEAEFASFKVNGVEYKVYFFQLENVQGNGTILTSKESEDLKGNVRILGRDGLVIGNITWDGTSGGKLKGTITPGSGMELLDPETVPGNIVVLLPTSESGNSASGTATYTYDNGTSTPSEFYLNWTSDGTVTGINQIDVPSGDVSVENSRGNLVVAGTDGTVVGVYDLNGRQVASETISGGSVTIEGLTPGIYVVNGQKVLLK